MPLGSDYLASAYLGRGFVSGSPGGVTLSRSNTEALDGLWSLKITNDAAPGTITVEVGPYPVTAGDVYSWTAAFLDGGSHESAFAAVSWYDGATLISTSDGSVITTSQTAWEASVGTATAPATATLAFIEFTIEAAPASSVFYVDGAGLFPGPSSVWSYPGVGVASTLALTYALNSLVVAS